MPTLHSIIESTQRLRSSKWYFDINHYAESVGITAEEANGFFKCIRDGGTKSGESWKQNPAPFEGKIDLTCQNDNLLNIHLADCGNKATTQGVFAQPSDSILSHSRRFVYVGKVSRRNKDITPKVQREIAQYVVGTKWTCQMVGEQMMELKERYTEHAIAERIPIEIRAENTITSIKSKGMMYLDDEFAAKKMDLSRAKQQKNQGGME